ncbi:MAG: DUF1501 domain-containing protein [Deltaproteobacteria bacterium]|nr:DUF1501 domain-containing protein [Deltaproteobacteria bacterium]
MINRRQLLGAFGHGALAAGLVPALMGRALTARAAAPSPAGRRFLFVVNQGGWDPLTAIAPKFGASRITMPLGALPATVGGVPIVDHALRPSVRAFFERWGARTLVLHGVSVRSVAHDVCQVTMMTGQATGGAPDVATRLARLGEGDALPHLVVAGPTYPGPLGSLVARSGASGQLQALVTGELLGAVDSPVDGPSRAAGRVIDDFVRRRTDAFVAAAPTARRQALASALARATRLEDLQWDMSLAADGSFGGQIDVAVEALARGVARCVTVSPPVSWDTHTDSDNQQSQLWELLFAGLARVMGRLSAAASPAGENRKLLDDVVVVVLSEMARTPQLNADQGRDHWPWTSALVIGDGITGGRVVGGYDPGYAGQGVDPATGELDEAAPAPSPAALAATLLQLADLDPGVMGPGVVPLTGVLA